MDRHRRIPQKRFGAGGGDSHAHRLARLWIDDIVADVPEMPLHLLVKHLVVADGGLQEGVPVHQPLAAADKPPVKQPEKSGSHRSSALLVEREAHAIPIATRSQIAQLPKNARFILLLPVPDPGHQFLPTEIMAGEFFFFEQATFHHRLCGDAGVVGAGHPEREKPLHAPRAHQQILQCVVEGMAQMESTGHIRRRNNHRKRLAASLRFGMPVPARIPQAAAAGLGGAVIVMLGKLLHGNLFYGQAVGNQTSARKQGGRC